MNIIFPVVSLQQVNNIRAQLSLPLLTAWSPKDFTLRDITPAQASDLVQFATLAQQPPAPGPNPTVPATIDGLRVRNLGTVGTGQNPPMRIGVGNMKNEALVFRLGDGFNVANLFADAQQLNRQVWITSDLNLPPQWVRGSTARPKPDQYAVFRNMKAGDGIGTTLEINIER